MARIGHRRVLLRLYEDVPQHQEILRWMDGYSGRGLQEILRGALLIGLPQLLSARPEPARMPEPERKLEPMQKPEPIQQSPEPIQRPEPVAPKQVAQTKEAMPAFVPSRGGEIVPSNEAHGALKKLFEWEG